MTTTAAIIIRSRVQTFYGGDAVVTLSTAIPGREDDARVDIFFHRPLGADRQIAQVNWAAFGSVEPLAAEVYGKLLGIAALVAHNIDAAVAANLRVPINADDIRTIVARVVEEAR